MKNQAEGTDGKTVFYVEDNSVNVLLMTSIFALRPALSLVLATSGADALQRASGIHPALLLLDLGLPDCHGSELLAQLRHLPSCRNVPAIAVTAEYGFRIQGTGFCELWAKPLDLSHVLARLDALVASPEMTPFGRIDVPLHQAPQTWQSRAV